MSKVPHVQDQHDHIIRPPAFFLGLLEFEISNALPHRGLLRANFKLEEGGFCPDLCYLKPSFNA